MIRSVMTAVLLALATGALAQAPSLDEVRRLLREGRVESALTAIEARLAVDAGDRDTRFLHGVALAEMQDSDGAIRVFTALSREHPDLPEPYNNLAVLYAARGDYEKARDALLQAINTHPSYATAHENLGDIYAKMAGLAYSQALSLDAANAAAKDKLALIDDLFSRAPVAGAARTGRAAPEPVAEPASGAVSAQPSAAPRVPAAGAGTLAADAAREAIAAIQTWAAAWSQQDVEGYLAAYAPGFAPPGMTRAAWEAQRRTRLRKPAFIQVGVERFEVRDAGGGRLDVTFVQQYRSNTYRDRVRKRLSLERGSQGWKIIDERIVAKL